MFVVVMVSEKKNWLTFWLAKNKLVFYEEKKKKQFNNNNKKNYSQGHVMRKQCDDYDIFIYF